jgi:superfamily II DNA helicase RecQ
VVNKARQKMRQYKPGKIVIYSNSVAKVKTLTEQLGCDAYYHDAVGKASMLADFMAGKQRVMVATSALGMGVDIPDIRYIIHVGWPRTILDYAQESDRAGRDGVRSEAIIVAQRDNEPTCYDQQTEAEQQLVRVYAEGEDGTARCRRRVLDTFLDGREVGRWIIVSGQDAPVRVEHQTIRVCAGKTLLLPSQFPIPPFHSNIPSPSPG